MKKFLTLFMAILFVGFFTLSCDKPETNIVSSDMNVSESIQPMYGLESVPESVEWDWRRVQTDGHQSVYGVNNINGTGASTPAGDEPNWGLVTPDGSGLDRWWGDGERVTNSVIGSYALKLETSIGGSEKAFNSCSFRVGAAINSTDNITVSLQIDDVSEHIDLFLFKMKGYDYTGGSYSVYFQNFDYSLSSTSSWTRYDIAFNSPQTFDVGHLRLPSNPVMGIYIEAEDGYTCNLTFDDIRLYSSATDLPPVFERALTPVIIFGIVDQPD